ncbi:Hypothetical predicted protein [Drosophila guanche]|uniref:Uncharacterized protein n=1 Tax=Drosophila guanche TaxID=7266 RepID=A0A3B0JX48_DROGU|nr:Hypothetical predicted protein [Drosophila guanche]
MIYCTYFDIYFSRSNVCRLGAGIVAATRGERVWMCYRTKSCVAEHGRRNICPTNCLERIEDLTPHEACDKFLHEVLPIVNTYKLPTKVKKRLRLLDLHPCFRLIEQGYQYVPNAELSTCFVLKANRDFRLASALPTVNRGPKAQLLQQILIVLTF